MSEPPKGPPETPAVPMPPPAAPATATPPSAIVEAAPPTAGMADAPPPPPAADGTPQPSMAPPPVGPPLAAPSGPAASGQAPVYPTSLQPPKNIPNWDGFAIVGLITAVFGLILFGIILGIVGVVRTKDGQRRGRGLAVAAIVISCLWVLFIGAAVVLYAVDEPQRSTSGEVVDEGSENFEDVSIGDCIKDATEGIKLSVAVTPCNQPHRGEVFALYNMIGTEYPGEDAVLQKANSGCQSRLPDSILEAPEAKDLSVFVYYPRDVNWAAGDREIICIAYSPDKSLNAKLGAN